MINFFAWIGAIVFGIAATYGPLYLAYTLDKMEEKRK